MVSNYRRNVALLLVGAVAIVASFFTARSAKNGPQGQLSRRLFDPAVAGAVEGPVTRQSASMTAKDGEGGREPLTFELKGFLQDESGGAVAGAVRFARFQASGESTEDGGVLHVSDGSFVLTGLLSGTWALIPEADGFYYPDVSRVVRIPADLGSPVVMQFCREAKTLQVRLVDGNGTPVEQGIVTIGSESGRPARAIERGAGVYVVDDLDSGTYLVRAMPSLSHLGNERIVALAPGGPRDVQLVMRAYGMISGQALGPDDEPLVGWKVKCTRPSLMNSFDQSEIPVLTDSHGRFSLARLAPGQRLVQVLPSETVQAKDELGVSGSGTGMLCRTVEVQEGQTCWVLLGGLEAQWARLDGRVMLGGEAVIGVELSVRPLGRCFMAWGPSVQTDAEGRYFVNLLPGDYGVSVLSVGGNVFSSVVAIPRPGKKVFDLELPEGRIEGTVVGDNGPIAGASVGLERIGEQSNIGSCSVQTDDLGMYVHTWLTPGSYRLSAGSLDQPNCPLTVRVVHLELEEIEKGVDLELRGGGRIAGQVLGSTGANSKPYEVVVRDTSGGLVDIVRVERAGTFRSPRLSAGVWAVSARAEGLVSNAWTEVTVGNGRTSRVELSLQPGGTLVAAAVDETGSPIAATMRLYDSSGWDRSGERSASAFASMPSFSETCFGPLAPGDYQIVATGLDGRVGRATARIATAGVQRIEIVVEG